MLMTLPLRPHAHTPQPRIVSPCSGHLTSRASSPRASLPERVSVTLTLTCCVELLVSLLTLSLSFATLGVHPRIRPAWRPAARDLIRLAPGLPGLLRLGASFTSRHIASTTPTGQRPTANGERPSVAMATSMYVSVRIHAHAHAPSQSTSTSHHDLSEPHESNRC